MTLVRQSPAKINLILNILGQRPDGFHELETVLQPVPVCDTLRFEHAPGGVELSCSDPELPTDGSNLVARAATAFLQAAGVEAGVRIHLEKRLPLAAGLGGGSGNAAATLLGMNELFGAPLPAAALAPIASGLGSDVPFFLQSKPALATGRGDAIQPLEPFPALREAWMLLVYPGFGVATPWAYRNLARFPAARNGQPGRAASLIAKLQGDDLVAASAGFYNSLEPPVFEKHPILAIYQEFLRAHGAVAALMSGSGSTTFALLPTQTKAEQLREIFLANFGATCWTAVAAFADA